MTGYASVWVWAQLLICSLKLIILYMRIFKYNNIKILKSNLWYVFHKSGTILSEYFEPLFCGEDAV